MSQVVIRKAIVATTQRNIAAAYPEFPDPPTQTDIDLLLKRSNTTEQAAARDEYIRRQNAIITEDDKPRNRMPHVSTLRREIR